MATVKEALEGAGDILAEMISDDAKYRTWIRKITMSEGRLVSKARDEKASSVYEMYYDFEEPVNKIAGHRVLAINRGEKEKFLNVRVDAPKYKIMTWLKRQVITR